MAAGIIDDPIFYFSSVRIFLDIFRSHDGDTRAFLGSNARAVDAGCEMRGIDSIDPGMKIGSVFWKQASTLFLIEKDDGLRRKSFRARGRDRGSGVGTAESGRVPSRFDLRISATIEENEKAETCFL